MCVVSLILGFVLGRQTMDQTTVDYTPLPPIVVTPTIPDPVESIPINPKLPAELMKPAIVYVDKPVEDGYRAKYFNLLNEYNVVTVENDQMGRMVKMVVDSLAVLNDYCTLRQYQNWVMYDIETVGKFVTSMDVQFNRIQRIYDCTLTPTQKTVTTVRRRTVIPFLSASYMTNKYVGAGGGLFIKNIGIEYNYMRNTQHGGDAHMVSLKYGF